MSGVLVKNCHGLVVSRSPGNEEVWVVFQIWYQRIIFIVDDDSNKCVMHFSILRHIFRLMLSSVQTQADFIYCSLKVKSCRVMV